MDPQWSQVAIQLGALGILGYHLIFGLPKMLADAQAAWAAMLSQILTDQKDERTQVDQRNSQLTAAVDRLTASGPAVCRYPGFGNPPKT